MVPLLKLVSRTSLLELPTRVSTGPAPGGVKTGREKSLKAVKTTFCLKKSDVQAADIQERKNLTARTTYWRQMGHSASCLAQAVQAAMWPHSSSTHSSGAAMQILQHSSGGRLSMSARQRSFVMDHAFTVMLFCHLV